MALAVVQMLPKFGPVVGHKANVHKCLALGQGCVRGSCVENCSQSNSWQDVFMFGACFQTFDCYL